MSAPARDSARRWLDGLLLAPEPVAAAVAYRVFLAAWTAAFLVPRLPHLDELYGRTVIRDAAYWYRLLGDPVPPGWWLRVCAGALLVALVLVAAGVRPRASQVAVAVLLTYLHWLDIGAPRAYGKLALIQWWLLACAPTGPLRAADGSIRDAPRWGTRLLMLQFSSVYVFAVGAKLTAGDGWLTGDALYYTWHAPVYGQFLVSDWVAISRPVARALAVSVLCAELLAGIGLWLARTRLLAMLAVVLLHAGMMLTLRVSPLFHALMIGHLVLFARPETLARLARLVARPRRSSASISQPRPRPRPASTAGTHS